MSVRIGFTVVEGLAGHDKITVTYKNTEKTKQDQVVTERTATSSVTCNELLRYIEERDKK